MRHRYLVRPFRNRRRGEAGPRYDLTYCSQVITRRKRAIRHDRSRVRAPYMRLPARVRVPLRRLFRPEPPITSPALRAWLAAVGMTDAIARL